MVLWGYHKMRRNSFYECQSQIRKHLFPPHPPLPFRMMQPDDAGPTRMMRANNEIATTIIMKKMKNITTVGDSAAA